MVDRYDVHVEGYGDYLLDCKESGELIYFDDYEKLQQECEALKKENDRLIFKSSGLKLACEEKNKEIEAINYSNAWLSNDLDWAKEENKKLKSEIEDLEELQNIEEGKRLIEYRKAKTDRMINNQLIHFLKHSNFYIKDADLSRIRMMMNRKDLAMDDVMPEIVKWAERGGRELAAKAVLDYEAMLSSFPITAEEYAEKIRNGDVKL